MMHQVHLQGEPITIIRRMIPHLPSQYRSGCMRHDLNARKYNVLLKS